MWIEPRRIGGAEARGLGEVMRLAPEEIEAMAAAAERSDPALAFIGDRPIAVCGFMPLTLFGATAYAWMQWTHEIYDLPICTTRMFVGVFGEARKRYSRIIGHCSYGPKPQRLLTRLGAKFMDGPDGRPMYIMENTP